MVSQETIGHRTCVITLQWKALDRFLLGLGLIVTALEWHTNLFFGVLVHCDANLYGRMPAQKEVCITAWPDAGGHSH